MRETIRVLTRLAAHRLQTQTAGDRPTARQPDTWTERSTWSEIVGEIPHDARPLMARAKEPALASRLDLAQTNGVFVLANVYEARNMKGVKPGTIKKLLIMEDIPKSASRHGPRGAHGGHISLHRILGEVPVEADDPNYVKVRNLIAETDARQRQLGRLEYPGYRPQPYYCYWMKRFGILPADFDIYKDPVDVYETDDRYWRSLHWQPRTGATTAK